MIKAESYKMRLDSEEGLSFIEFNYMVLQAYDFLELTDGHNCCLQMGGSDQWGNIVAGIDLIRRVESKSAFGITFPLITTSQRVPRWAKPPQVPSGWTRSEPAPTTIIQFWVNTDDRDVAAFWPCLPFCPWKRFDPVTSLEGAQTQHRQIYTGVRGYAVWPMARMRLLKALPIRHIHVRCQNDFTGPASLQSDSAGVWSAGG
jgi:tyrosyl-tRNA synthetase